MALAFALLVGVIWTPTASAAGADLAEEDPAGSQELAERYAPVMVLKAQDAPCDEDGEPYAPTSVDILLDNPEIVLRQVGRNDPVITTAPSAADLFGLSEGFYLDFPGGTFEPGCIYEADFNRYNDGQPAVVYAHIVQQEDHPDKLALQYWFYWYYNDWNNKHESDWEGIQVLFEASSIDEALSESPVSVGYAQHEGGEQADWDDSKLEREGTHPLVYSSAGSHASYFGSALYLGRSGSEGFGCDNTDGPSENFDPTVVVLPDSVDGPSDPLAWLAYQGRWGERQSGPFNGPTGPIAKGRWLEPIDWHDELRSASVVIPAGDSDGLSVITAFCDIVEQGAGVLIQLKTSPLSLALSALVVFFIARWFVRRTEWNRVPSTPIVSRRRAGQIIRASWRLYRGDFKARVLFGLIFVPTAVVAGLIGALVLLIPLVGDVLDAGGTDSLTGVVFVLMAGGLANLAAYVVVNALVAAHMDDSTSERRSAGESARFVWAKRGELVRGFLRAVLIVGALLVSIVGIPWGIRQLIRYQFLPQAVVLDGVDGRGGLDRSSDLVKGRWFHTATMITVFNGLVVASGMVVGLLMLVLFARIPLWLFSAMMPLVYALIVPLTASGQTMLYGDAVADNADVDTVPKVPNPQLVSP
jgi:hypothetical protein